MTLHLLKDEVLVKRQSLVYLINLFNISYFFINSLVVYLSACFSTVVVTAKCDFID